MQTELEIKAIKKRIIDETTNSTKLYGVKGNEVKGYSVDDEYDINGDDAKKGGGTVGSLVDHLNSNFDFSVGGDVEDVKNRKRQQGYVLPGKVTYSAENIYSDADNIKIDTSANIGQVVIY